MSARSICVNDTDGDGNCAACARNPQAPCRRSARDAIDNLGDCYLTPGVHKRLMGLLDAYAHELAEEIRALGITQWEGMNESVRMLRKMRAQAADLIDPEVP